MTTQSKVKKWGNSLGIRISKSMADEVNITENTVINLSVNNNSIILTPAPKKINLEELISRITPENTHLEIDFGDRVGKEIW
jgi:antitoxin MazE